LVCFAALRSVISIIKVVRLMDNLVTIFGEVLMYDAVGEFLFGGSHRSHGPLCRAYTTLQPGISLDSSRRRLLR
jgi:hypothetical protein